MEHEERIDAESESARELDLKGFDTHLSNSFDIDLVLSNLTWLGLNKISFYFAFSDQNHFLFLPKAL